MRREAVIGGCKYVDKRSPDYDGWDGLCLGVDVDVARMRDAVRSRMDGVTWLRDAECSWSLYQSNVACAVRRIVDAEGGLLMLYWSGHGGQVRDINGDEVDGLDETICFWERQVTDDELADTLSTIPACVRVLVITDCCHAGTMLRSAGRRIVHDRRGVLRLPALRKAAAPVIHFGVCGEAKYSYGDQDGGAFTNALLLVLARGARASWFERLLIKETPALTYQRWFDDTKREMPRKQRPIRDEYGAGCSTFLNMEVLT